MSPPFESDESIPDLSEFETSKPEEDISHSTSYPPMSFEATLMPTKLHTRARAVSLDLVHDQDTRMRDCSKISLS